MMVMMAMQMMTLIDDDDVEDVLHLEETMMTMILR